MGDGGGPAKCSIAPPEPAIHASPSGEAAIAANEPKPSVSPSSTAQLLPPVAE